MIPEDQQKVRMALDLEVEGGRIVATMLLEGFDNRYRAVGAAALQPDGDPNCPSFAGELAVARALSDLHHQLLERVHERIDRSTGDI